MPDESVKRRMRRAKGQAVKRLVGMGYDVVPSDNSRVCVVAFRQSEIRMVRIVLDRMTPQDQKILASVKGPANCTREIWIRKGSANASDFQIHAIL